MCDIHGDVPAVRRVQGETDSFGCEYNDFCESCYQEFKNEPVDRSGTCDWCRETATDLRDKRDYEEGFCGRVYRVCGACNDKYEARMAEDLLGDYYDYVDEYEPTAGGIWSR